MVKIITLTALFFVGALGMAQTSYYMEYNNIRARYYNNGMLFKGFNGTSSFEVPKNSGKTSIFASGLWLSAQDENQNKYCAVSQYNTNGNDFHTGPLKKSGLDQGTTTESEVLTFDKIWNVSKVQIENHIENYSFSTYEMPQGILTWPAHGNYVQDYTHYLAPFIDVNENGMYEPNLGDYPDIKGDQSIYWIFNDNFGEHEESTGSTPLKVEIHAQAYSFSCTMNNENATILNNTNFIEYRIINRSQISYHDFKMAFFTDGDLGDPTDDYIGTNVGLNSLYFYNGDDMDGTGVNQEYGLNPPAQFICILDGPFANNNDYIDNDNDGTIDEEGEKCLLSRSVYYGGGGAMGDPTQYFDFYNYLDGYWRDGRSYTYGGTGYRPFGGTQTKYIYPGASDPWNNGTWGESMDYNLEGGWTEANEEHEPGDRKGLAICGAVNLEPNQELKFELALVWSRGEDGAMSSVNKGFTDVAQIIEMYKEGTLDNCVSNISVNEVDKNESLEVFPNPVTDLFVIKGAEIGSHFELLNLKGQLLMKGSINQETINIIDLTEGTYVLKIIQKNESKTIKIVKI